MPRLNSSNNAETTLATAITPTDTSITVTDASLFPNAPFRITINGEILEVATIDRGTNRFSSIQRGLEGTTAASHSAGTSIQNRFTAGTYAELATDFDLDSVSASLTTTTNNLTSTTNTLNTHLNNKENPHGVTAAQVGALATTGTQQYVGGSLEFTDAQKTLSLFLAHNDIKFTRPGNRSYITQNGLNGSLVFTIGGDDYDNYKALELTNSAFIVFPGAGVPFSFKNTELGQGVFTHGTNGMFKFILNTIQARNAADTAYIPIHASAFTVASEREMKMNISNIEDNALDKVCATQVYTFQYKETEDNQLNIGVMANEAPKEVLTPDGKRVSLNNMVGMVWKAVQELNQKVDSIKGRV